MKDYSLYLTLLFLACLAFLIVRTRFIDGFEGGSDVESDLVPEANGSSSSSASAGQQIVLPAGGSDDPIPNTNGSSSSSYLRTNLEIVLPAGSSSSSNLSNILNTTGRLFSSSSSAASSKIIQLPPTQITIIKDNSSNDSAYIPPEFDNETQTAEVPAAATENTSPTASEATKTLSTAQIAAATLLIGGAVAVTGIAGVHIFGIKM